VSSRKLATRNLLHFLFSGYSYLGTALEQFQTTVRPMAQRYVHPTRQFADVVLTGDGAIAEEMELVLNHIKAGSSRGSGT